MLSRLVEKQHLDYRAAGARYLYAPRIKRARATRNALSSLVETFFDGCAAQAANALLGMSLKNLNSAELDALESLIQQATVARPRSDDMAHDDGCQEPAGPDATVPAAKRR